MSENKRKKAGLHKKVSTIFNGISTQQNDNVQEPIETTEQQPTSQNEPEAVSLESQVSETEQPVIEPIQSPVSEAKQTPDLQPEEIQSQEINVPENSDATNSLVLKMDEFDTKHPQESEQQESKKKKPPLPKPKKPVILTMDESDIPEAEEFPISESQETQASTPEELPAEKTEEATQPVPEAEPSQELQVDIGGDDIEQDSSDKFAALKNIGKHLWEQIDSKLLAPKPGVNPIKQKAAVIMIPLLLVVLIFVLRGVFGTPAPNTETAMDNKTHSANVTTSSDNSIEWEIPAPYKPKSRNPLQLGPTETTIDDEIYPGQLVQLNVQGILVTDDKPSAAVNGQIVYVGEKIRGVTIVKITKENVEFEFNGKRWTQTIR